MNKEVYIHIGLPKCASTFFQEKIFSGLKDFELLYPPYTQHNWAFNKLQYADDLYYNEEDFTEEIKKWGKDKILISDENLSGKAMGIGVINRSIIAHRLHSLFPHAKVLLFLRGQQQIIYSIYNQWIKGYTRGHRRVDDFLWKPEVSLGFENSKRNEIIKLENLFYNTNLQYLNVECFLYFELIKMYKELFKDVTIVMYEDLEANPERMFQYISNFLNQSVNYKKEYSTNRINSGIYGKDMEKLMIRNRLSRISYNKSFHKIFTPLLRHFSSLYKNHNVFRIIEEKTRGYYAQNNQKIIAAFPEIGIQDYPQLYTV